MGKNFYSSIMEGLNEVIDEVKNKKNSLKRDYLSIEVEPIKEYLPQEIRRIRESLNLSQQLFAYYLGVSKKTVEAWEYGKNKPSGCSNRLLQMLEQNKNLINEYPFIKIKRN